MGNKKQKIFLIPYAGSSVMTYSVWIKHLSDNSEFVFLEMPGRGIKSEQELISNINKVVNLLYDELVHQLEDEDYVIFGHSMGSLIGYELYYKIVREKFRLPHKVVFSGRVPPELCINIKNVSNYPEEEFLAEVDVYGGLPPEVKHNKELREYFLPILRSDFKLIEDYVYKEREELIESNLTVLYGSEDYSTTAKNMMSWRKKVAGNFTCGEFPGGHFFCFDEPNIPVIVSLIEDNKNIRQKGE